MLPSFPHSLISIQEYAFLILYNNTKIDYMGLHIVELPPPYILCIAYCKQ